jgi:hypothetical protein
MPRPPRPRPINRAVPGSGTVAMFPTTTLEPNPAEILRSMLKI